MMKNIKAYLNDSWQILKKTGKAWMAADPFRQSAVIAYYAIFSIPPLLVIIITCAGFAFGREAVQGEISNQIGSAMGTDTAKQVEEMIAKVSMQKNSIWATIISIVTLILGATGVFGQLQTSINQIWEVEVKAKRAWLKTIKDRLFSFGLIISIGFLLLISLLITTALAAFSEWIKVYLPDYILFVFHIVNFIFSLAVVSVLFALMFRILPDAKVRWRDVWVGAIVTALLFTLGKYALGIYFGKAEPASTYGAAGSIVLIMLWVSYSCMLVFFGAEFTKQHAIYFGRGIEPAKDAVRIKASEEEKTLADKKAAVSH